MDSHWLTDDQSIFDQLPDLLEGTGSGNFIGLTGVKPDLLFTSADKRQPLLKPEYTHGDGCSSKKKKNCKKS